MSQRYAPSVRVEIRDAEWRVKCIDHTSDGGELLTCEGLSELVRGREATFLRAKHRPRLERHPTPKSRRHRQQNLHRHHPSYRSNRTRHRLPGPALQTQPRKRLRHRLGVYSKKSLI